jgi:hypothetical protein
MSACVFEYLTGAIHTAASLARIVRFSGDGREACRLDIEQEHGTAVLVRAAHQHTGIARLCLWNRDEFGHATRAVLHLFFPPRRRRIGRLICGRR